MTRILIIDDHALIREGFKKLIDAEADMMVVGEAENAREGLQLATEIESDVIILDITMPDKHGLELLKDLRQSLSEVRILILTMHPQEHYALRALKAGAMGYVTKMGAPQELIRAIRKIMSGRPYIGAELAEFLAQNVNRNEGKTGYNSLSDRELEVFDMIARGKSVKEISEDLCISISTVNTYRKRILQKMNMRSNTDIIYYAANTR